MASQGSIGSGGSPSFVFHIKKKNRHSSYCHSKHVLLSLDAKIQNITGRMAVFNGCFWWQLSLPLCSKLDLLQFMIILMHLWRHDKDKYEDPRAISGQDELAREASLVRQARCRFAMQEENLTYFLLRTSFHNKNTFFFHPQRSFVVLKFMCRGHYLPC